MHKWINKALFYQDITEDKQDSHEGLLISLANALIFFQVWHAMFEFNSSALEVVCIVKVLLYYFHK